MKISDRMMGCFLLLFATGILVQASRFPLIPGQSVGSGLLPTIVALGLMLCALVLIAKDVLAPDRPKLVQVGEWATDRRRVTRVVIAVLGTASFIPLMGVIGFPLLSIVVLFAFLLSLQVNIATSAVLSVVASLAIHTLFSKVFLVPLPWGVLQFIAW